MRLLLFILLFTASCTEVSTPLRMKAYKPRVIVETKGGAYTAPKDVSVIQGSTECPLPYKYWNRPYKVLKYTVQCADDAEIEFLDDGTRIEIGGTDYDCEMRSLMRETPWDPNPNQDSH